MAGIREPRTETNGQSIAFRVNGRAVVVSGSPLQRLSRALRDELGLTGTKVGCDAGDCGACTVLLDGDPVCACLVAAGQAEGCEVTTVEGLADTIVGGRLQRAFLTHGAAQCGACTPGMLVAATALLERNPAPHENEVMDAIGGVLCRCTGYRKIIAAILDAGVKNSGVENTASAASTAVSPEAGAAVGKRLVRLDGKQKVDGSELFGADETPASALAVRAIRSPYHRARFHFGELATGARLIHEERPGNILVRGRVVQGDVDRALAAADVVVDAEYETGFVEHAYIEPEAGFARRVDDQIEIQACTQSPYMDRSDIA